MYRATDMLYKHNPNPANKRGGSGGIPPRRIHARERYVMPLSFAVDEYLGNAIIRAHAEGDTNRLAILSSFLLARGRIQ